MMLNREYLDDSQSVEFRFIQNKDDFIVDEIPSQKFTGKGNYLIVHVQKVGMTTWDMIAVFAEYLAIPAQKIGYGGLKDKHATTTQYLSFEIKYEQMLRKFTHSQIKILNTVKNNKSIRMGDLQGNRFSINLHEVDNIDAGKIEKKARKIEKNGLANYFGYQRFGRNNDSIEQAKEMIKGDLFIADNKLKNFLISVYQSYYFNEWLKERVVLSREKNSGKFLLLEGDVYLSNDNKLSTPKLIPTKDFEKKKLIPTGLLCGKDVFRAREGAREIEKKYDDEFLQEKGLRREALVFPSGIVCNYNKKTTSVNITFELPKGSYATVFLEAICNKSLVKKNTNFQR